jgi:transcriptional regulator with XRE-family HTH domain
MEKTNIKRKPNHLRKYRKARGLDQQEVAKILGLKSTSVISRWEKGFCMPGPIFMFKLAILYRTMVDALFIEIRRGLLEEMRNREDMVLGKKKTDTQK